MAGLVAPLGTPPPSIWNDGVKYKEYSDGMNYKEYSDGVNYKEYSDRGQEMISWETG